MIEASGNTTGADACRTCGHDATLHPYGTEACHFRVVGRYTDDAGEHITAVCDCLATSERGRVMDIVEFLRARIAEDPVRITEEDMSSMTTHNHPYAFMPHAPRALREKEAKTTIVSAYELLAARPHGMAQALDQALWSVKVVASVYANHPDYDESWRP